MNKERRPAEKKRLADPRAARYGFDHLGKKARDQEVTFVRVYITKQPYLVDVLFGSTEGADA